VSDSLATINDVIDAFEERLSEAPLSLDLMPRIQMPQAANRSRTMRGFSVDAPSTSNTDEYRDIDLASAEDQVLVTLFYAINAKDQKASRREAHALEEQVRELLVDPSWRGEWHVRWRTTTRGPDPQTAETYRITQTFTVSRDASLGG
jgi:hypothetical protein